MGRSGMKNLCGKPIPKTIDAIRFGKRYLDPDDLKQKCLDAATLGLTVITGIMVFIVYFI